MKDNSYHRIFAACIGLSQFVVLFQNCLIKIVNGARYGVVADLGLATHLPENEYVFLAAQLFNKTQLKGELKDLNEGWPCFEMF